jgi:hypothetical protein
MEFRSGREEPSKRDLDDEHRKRSKMIRSKHREGLLTGNWCAATVAKGMGVFSPSPRLAQGRRLVNRR